MTNNIEIITPLLDFKTKDDFYYLQILQRKKENSELGANSRVIKNYYITSIDYLNKVYDEIKTLCTIFNARAMLRLNKRSFHNVAFKTMVNIANVMINQDYFNIKSQYDKACGQGHNDNNKTWILDIDGEMNRKVNEMIIYIERECQPDGNKFITIIPSKNGSHIITKPFQLDKFKQIYPLIDVQKDNPTNLFIP
jgi:hypothetical protein